MPMISFDTPWKHKKTCGFLMFSGGIKRDRWHEMGWENNSFNISNIWTMKIIDLTDEKFLQAKSVYTFKQVSTSS